jgi:hypothetical protein
VFILEQPANAFRQATGKTTIVSKRFLVLLFMRKAADALADGADAEAAAQHLCAEAIAIERSGVVSLDSDRDPGFTPA